MLFVKRHAEAMSIAIAKVFQITYAWRMDIMAPLSGEATLEIILDNRERRVLRQRDLLEKHRLPIVSFTVNMPGPVKDNRAARIAFAEGARLLDALIRERGWTSPERRMTEGPAGPELIVSIDTDARELKERTVALEEASSLGRLFDMDVLDAAGSPVSRAELGLAPRLCLLCGRPAKECGRSRKHGLDAVLAKVAAIAASHGNV